MKDEYFTPQTMTPTSFLARFDKVRRKGSSHDGTEQWLACCPAHNDKSPSLLIGMKPDGRWLLKCYAGCGASHVMDAIGLTLADLFPRNGIGNDGAFVGFGGVRGSRPGKKSHEQVMHDLVEDKIKRGTLSEKDRAELMEAKKRGNNDWPIGV